MVCAQTPNRACAQGGKGENALLAHTAENALEVLGVVCILHSKRFEKGKT